MLFQNLFRMSIKSNRYADLKIRKFYLSLTHQKMHYSSEPITEPKPEIESKIQSEMLHLFDKMKHSQSDQGISNFDYQKLVNLARDCITIDQSISIYLIKLAGIDLYNRFPDSRQKYLNYLLFDLYPEKNVDFENSHFYYYMKNTNLNNHQFDAFKVNTFILKRHFRTDPEINSLIVNQLCRQKDISTAYSYIDSFKSSPSEPNLLLLKPISNQIDDEKLFELIYNNVHNNRLSNIDLLNPFLKYFYDANKLNLANSMFEKMNNSDIKLNSATYTNVIIGNENTEYAKKLLDEHKMLIQIDDLAEIYLRTNNADLATSILTQISEYLNPENYLNSRLVLMNLIVVLCMENKISKAFNLATSDLISCEMRKELAFKLSQSLVEFNQEFNYLIQASNDLDKSTSNIMGYHLKLMIKHASIHSKKVLAIDLIDELIKISPTSADTSIFSDLIDQEAKSLDILLTDQRPSDIKKLENFKRISNLIKTIDRKVKIVYTDLIMIISILRLRYKSALRKNFNSIDIVEIFRTNEKKHLLNACGVCLTDFVINENFDKIDFVLNELSDLIDHLNMDSINQEFIIMLTNLFELYANKCELSQHIDLVNSGWFKMIKKLNEKDQSESLVNLNNMIYLKLKETLPDTTKLDNFYKNNSIRQNNLDKKIEHNYEIRHKKETIKELEMKIIHRSKKGQFDEQAIRRLIIKICERPQDYKSIYFKLEKYNYRKNSFRRCMKSKRIKKYTFFMHLLR